MQCDDSIPVSDDPRHGSARNNINIMHNRAKWVVIDGLEYKKEAAVVYSVEDDLPQIVMIEFIYVINGSTVIFKGECFTSSYNKHFHAYTLHPLRRQSFYHHDKLAFYLPLHVRTPRVLPRQKVVILPFDISNF